MSGNTAVNRGWKETLLSWTHPRAVAMLFLGFSAGLPILLIFSTLSLWLREAGVSRSAVTFFSWAALGYSFKFLWAPLIDCLPVPWLTRLVGRRRSWLLVAQLGIIVSICLMGTVDPANQGNSLIFMAIGAVMLGFSSATQDIVIDAYRIESVDESMQAMLASMYIAGYRIGMLVAGAGALYLASWFGTSSEQYVYNSWRMTYLAMAAVMSVGVVTTIIIKEPKTQSAIAKKDYTPQQYSRILILFACAVFSFAMTFFYSGDFVAELKTDIVGLYPLSGKVIGFLLEVTRFACSVVVAVIVAAALISSSMIEKGIVVETYVAPILDFFKRYGLKTALLLLLLIGCYRISDIVLGVISNVFYADMGYSKNEIATITKTFGLGMTILGGFLGGFMTYRYGVYVILFLGALLTAGTNLLFMTLAEAGADTLLLTVVIAADNLSAGIAATAFVAFLSSLTNISFTATQYAIFSSLMTLFPKLLGGYSGTMVTAIGYQQFFLITAVMGIPVLILVWLAKKMVEG
ncbi:MFS transporter [Desulfopila sp. IMCC35008]|uniref:AmpG family muropeptide MFS transporter n=1 Tax=Desulfopila sp. IMCC35008 TaxID=2653858 RepID=UPI0013D874AB|nr:MFS transporter [Desulfopila sp. IMCC35008]